MSGEPKLVVDRSMICGHRGASEEYPENTFAAFKGAQEIGVGWIETDVQILADGGLVLFHDETLQRTSSCEGRLCDLTWAEVKQIDIGSWKSPEFAAERPIRMMDLLAWQQSSDDTPNIIWEIKIPQRETLDLVMQVADEVCRQLKICGDDRYFLTSFHRDLLRHVRRLSPSSPMALSSIALPTDWIEFCNECRMQALHLDGSVITERQVRDIKSEGFDVRCYTINERKHARRLFDWGVDMIFTDNPRLFLA